jgi:membrane protease YdiL (CAAX protease family)
LRVPRGTVAFSALGGRRHLDPGSLLSGPVPLQPDRRAASRTVLGAVVAGVIACAGFLAAALVARHLPVIGQALDRVLATADAGPTALVLLIALTNGIGEELFFRGALHAALEPNHPAITTTIAYVVVTAATGNLALIIAAAVMAVAFTLERLSTRGVVAPMVTHMTWSTLMVLALPR